MTKFVRMYFIRVYFFAKCMEYITERRVPAERPATGEFHCPLNMLVCKGCNRDTELVSHTYAKYVSLCFYVCVASHYTPIVDLARGS